MRTTDMRGAGSPDIRIFSNDKMIGRLLNYLFLSQGLSPVLSSYSYGGIEFLHDRYDSPVLAIFDIPHPPSSSRKPCDPLRRSEGLKEGRRIILSSQTIDCSSCECYLEKKCAHLQKPFATSELVGRAKSFLLGTALQ